MYSAWLAPVKPGKIMTIGESGHEFSSAQSRATSPPSVSVSNSLMNVNLKIIMGFVTICPRNVLPSIFDIWQDEISHNAGEYRLGPRLETP